MVAIAGARRRGEKSPAYGHANSQPVPWRRIKPKKKNGHPPVGVWLDMPTRPNFSRDWKYHWRTRVQFAAPALRANVSKKVLGFLDRNKFGDWDCIFNKAQSLERAAFGNL